MLRPIPVAAPAPPDDPLTEVLPLLQAKYIDFKALNYKQGDHLSDLIARSNGEISLSQPGATLAPMPILTANLPGNIVYWRLASFNPAKSWPDLATQLTQASGTAVGAILDLRSNTVPDDFSGAAHVISYFDPANAALSRFAVGALDPGIKPPLHLPLVVLTNGQTAGAAEALAAFLQADGALVVGRATKGNAAVYQEQTLSSGQILRFPVENILQADGTPLYGHPVMPDISPVVKDSAEKAALILIKDNQIDDVIQESVARHRMSEASLVQGQDPEWDDYLATMERKPVLLSLPVVHDVVLVSALDSLKAIRLSQRTLPVSSAVSIATPTSASVQ